MTNSVEIYTYNYLDSKWLVIDQLTTGVYFTNSLLPGTITNLALARTGSTLTGGVPIYTFTFSTVTVLP